MLVAAMLIPAPGWAEIKVKTLADGTRLIYNETPVQRARRISSQLLSVPRTDIAGYIDYHARGQGLSPRLVQAVMQVESGYNPKAVSRKGAMGLMQLMPETARELRVGDPFDPEQNIRGGTSYLRQLMGRFGSLELALAAYNAGPTAVTRHAGVPPYPETRNYVRKVLGLLHGSVPDTVREHVEWTARQQERQAAAQAQAAPAKPSGKKVYLTRDANNQIVFTTEAPETP